MNRNKTVKKKSIETKTESEKKKFGIKATIGIITAVLANVVGFFLVIVELICSIHPIRTIVLTFFIWRCVIDFVAPLFSQEVYNLNDDDMKKMLPAIVLSYFQAAFSCTAAFLWFFDIKPGFFLACIIAMALLLLILIFNGSGSFSADKKTLYKLNDIIQIVFLIVLSIMLINSIADESLRGTVLAILSAAFGGFITLIGVLMTINRERYDKEKQDFESKLDDYSDYLYEFPALFVVEHGSKMIDNYFLISASDPVPDPDNSIIIGMHNDCIYYPCALLIEKDDRTERVTLYPRYVSGHSLLLINYRDLSDFDNDTAVYLEICLRNKKLVTRHFDCIGKYRLRHYKGVVTNIFGPISLSQAPITRQSDTSSDDLTITR